MNKTNIDWATHCWNPVIGCRRGCPYCYAKKINDRFHLIPDFSKPELRLEKLRHPKMPKKPSRIFVNSMSDICYWHDIWMLDVLKIIRDYPQHTFIFLTKNPLSYVRFSFPMNCWLGVTWTGKVNYRSYMREILRRIYLGFDDKPNIKFVSFEPLLGNYDSVFTVTWGWIIVGGLTPRPVHKKEWVDKIIEIARAHKTPIFLKNNLHYPEKIQEYPIFQG